MVIVKVSIWYKYQVEGEKFERNAHPTITVVTSDYLAIEKSIKLVKDKYGKEKLFRIERVSLECHGPNSEVMIDPELS